VDAQHCLDGVPLSKQFLRAYVAGEWQPFLSLDGQALNPTP